MKINRFKNSQDALYRKVQRGTLFALRHLDYFFCLLRKGKGYKSILKKQGREKMGLIIDTLVALIAGAVFIIFMGLLYLIAACYIPYQSIFKNKGV